MSDLLVPEGLSLIDHLVSGQAYVCGSNIKYDGSTNELAIIHLLEL